MRQVSRGLDRIEVAFDEPNLVANAGLLLVSTLVVRLGLEALINSTLRLTGRVGGALPGRKVLSLVHAIVAGASHIDHVEGRGSYEAYSFGCVLVWLIILAIAAGADESKRRTIQLTCAGWWLGWLLATIARQVYPPPRCGEARSGV